MPYVDPLSSVYATALADSVKEKGGLPLLEEVGGRLAALDQAWRKSRSLRAYLLSADVPAAAKRAAIDKIGAGMPPLLANFLRLLHGRNRLAILGDVAVAFAERLNDEMGRVPVTLTTATPVPEEMIARWTEAIAKAVGKRPVLRHVVKPELIAGAIVHVGDLVADGSARRRLAELNTRILRSATHAIQS